MGSQGNAVPEGHDKAVVGLTLAPGFGCPHTPGGPEPTRRHQLRQYRPPDLLYFIFEVTSRKMQIYCHVPLPE